MLMRIGTKSLSAKTNIRKNGVPGGRAAAENTPLFKTEACFCFLDHSGHSSHKYVA